MLKLISIFILTISFSLYSQTEIKNKNFNNKDTKVQKTEKEWKDKLSPEQYYVCRQKGTERAFTGKYYDFYETGIYKCAACGAELFNSETKYDSGSGWPSFYDVLNSEAVKQKEDNSFMMKRIEVVCAKCESHLGHVFPDGPKEKTGLRYCINSASLQFEKK